jgi:hypothetical protein
VSDGHGQFIPIYFSAVDSSPEWVEFMASTEFAVWAVLCRYIWRSPEGSSLGLHNIYNEGFLCACVTQEKIMSHFGEYRKRSSIIDDLRKLEARKVIERWKNSKPTVYVLGRWSYARLDGRLKKIYQEVLYAEEYLAMPQQDRQRRNSDYGD